MVKERSMDRNENHDASSKRRCESSEHDGLSPWSDLSHDVLLLVMMQLSGVVDFIAFRGVCKSWRSLALSNRNNFIVSKPPMSIRIEKDFYVYCHLQDFEGTRFKTIIPHFASRTCVGFTCGYMILFGSKTHDFWLVNPITRSDLYIPGHVPSLENDYPRGPILVYSPSISGLVFVVSYELTTTIWFYVVATGTWNYFTSSFFVRYLNFFKGKIYAIVNGLRLCELRLNPEPKLTLIETKNSIRPTSFLYTELVTLGENLCLLSLDSGYPQKVVLMELDIGEMKWMLQEKKRVELMPLFSSELRYGNPFKPSSESWADPRSQYERYASFNNTTDRTRKRRLLL